MKLLCKLLVLLTLSVNATPLSRRAIIISGSPKDWQMKVLKNFLTEHSLHESSLIVWDLKNTQCKLIRAALLQLCFSKGEMKTVIRDEKLLKKTIGRLMLYAQTAKAHQKEGQYEK